MYKRAVAPEQRRPLPSRDGRTEKIDRLWLEIAPPCGRGRVERGRRCKVVVQTGRKGKAKGGWGRDRAAARSLSSSRKSMRSQFRAKVARTVTESTRRKERKDERKEGRKTRGKGNCSGASKQTEYTATDRDDSPLVLPPRISRDLS